MRWIRWLPTYSILLLMLIQFGMSYYYTHINDKPQRYFEIDYSYKVGDSLLVDQTGSFENKGAPSYDDMIIKIKNSIHTKVSGWAINSIKEVTKKQYSSDTATTVIQKHHQGNRMYFRTISEK